MTYKPSNPMPLNSARRPGTRTSPHHHHPSSPSLPPPDAPPSNHSLFIPYPPSTQDYIASGPAFEINQTVNITVEVTSSSAPAYDGYDVRRYTTPVTTTCYSNEPTSSASTGSHQYSMCESISNFSNYPFSPPPSAGTATSSSSSSPLQGHTPSTSSAASANYSHHASEGHASVQYRSQSEYSDSQPQENQAGRRGRPSTRPHTSPHR
ncbi:hypothetical protein C7212DRAFT_21516, partial [Tuber magnatum]